MPANEKMVEFSIPDGTASGYYVSGGAAKQPGLLVIHEWWGLNDQIKDVAERFAGEGYAVIAPDLYQGVLATDATQAGQLMQGLSQDYALKVLDGAIAYLKEQGQTRGEKVGVTGFCMGGSYALLLACHNSNIEATAPFYGDVPSDEVLKNLSAPVLFIGAENDPWITQDKMNGLKDALSDLNKEGEVKIYEGVGHAFFNDRRPEAYDEKAAQDAWERVKRFFALHLK